MNRSAGISLEVKPFLCQIIGCNAQLVFRGCLTAGDIVRIPGFIGQAVHRTCRSINLHWVASLTAHCHHIVQLDAVVRHAVTFIFRRYGQRSVCRAHCGVFPVHRVNSMPVFGISSRNDIYIITGFHFCGCTCNGGLQLTYVHRIRSRFAGLDIVNLLVIYIYIICGEGKSADCQPVCIHCRITGFDHIRRDGVFIDRRFTDLYASCLSEFHILV